MSIVGKSEVRVDAFDKATGRTKYYEDRMPSGALYARIKHSEIAHGYVKSNRGRREGPDVLRRAGHCLPDGRSPVVHGPRASGYRGPAPVKPACAVLRRCRRRGWLSASSPSACARREREKTIFRRFSSGSWAARFIRSTGSIRRWAA